MRAVILTLIALLMPLAAQARAYKTPEALIEALYSGRGQDNSAEALSPYAPFFSEQLTRRFQEDRDKTQPGEQGAIDFDPVISGQDGSAENVEISPAIVLDGAAELEVSFVNGEPVTLFYTLVKEDGGWKVDDIACQQGEFPWSLTGLFDGAAY